ncbi:nose resistant to fluoxetine protein 6-like isoform X2 [Haemaphysalis longicornis]
MACAFEPFFYVVMVTIFSNICSVRCASQGPIGVHPDHAFKQDLASMNLSSACMEDYRLYLQQLGNGTTWALKMYDSYGKPDSGILEGSHTFLGFYSECLDALPASTAAPETLKSSGTPNFYSIYCLSTLRMGPEKERICQGPLRPMCGELGGVDLTFAVCVPSTCNEEDVRRIAGLSLGDLGCTANATSSVCRVPMKSFIQDAPAVTVALFLVTLVAAVLGATAYDCKRRKSPKKCKTQPSSEGTSEYKNPVACNGPPDRTVPNCTENAILSFSLISNGKKLFGSQSPSSKSIRVLHGLRFFSMAWVICIHNRYESTETMIFRNPDPQNIFNFKTEFVLRATLAIDTFFFIGGLVVAYSTLMDLQKNGGKKNWLLFYVHRYLRTVPMLMVVVVICAFLMRHFGDGPRWADFLARYETNCHISWWTYPLFLQNFVLLDHQCLGHTWYSAADFQFYLISPPILYALYKKPRLGIFVIAVLCIISTTLSATYSSLIEMRFTDKDYDYYRDVYNKPYFRMSPYLLGMLMGNFLSKGHKSLGAPRKSYVYLGWLSCAFLTLFSVFGLWISDPLARTPWHGSFLAIASSLWVIGIAWIVYACVRGCGGIFSKVLASQAMEPLSKLTFCTYITHLMTIHIFFANLEETFYYSSFLMPMLSSHIPN